MIMNDILTVKFKKIYEDAIIPQYKYPTDSGFDFCTIEDISLSFNEIKLVRTGLSIELPSKISFLKKKTIDNLVEDLNKKPIFHSPLPMDNGGYFPYRSSEESNLIILIPELQIRTRSGLAINQGIQVVNSPATIDNSYRGEIKILLTRIIPGQSFFEKGERIAQGIISLVLSTSSVKFIEVDKLSKTERQCGGFGHTGTK